MAAEYICDTPKEASKFLHCDLCNGEGHGEKKDRSPCDGIDHCVCVGSEAAEEKQEIELDDEDANDGHVDTSPDRNKALLRVRQKVWPDLRCIALFNAFQVVCIADKELDQDGLDAV